MSDKVPLALTSLNEFLPDPKSDDASVFEKLILRGCYTPLLSTVRNYLGISNSANHNFSVFTPCLDFCVKSRIFGMISFRILCRMAL